MPQRVNMPHFLFLFLKESALEYNILKLVVVIPFLANVLCCKWRL